LYNQTIKSVELFKENDESNLTNNNKTTNSFLTTLEKYDDNLLEKTIPDYISELNDKYNCKVKIYLANEDYTKVELYKYKSE
jgi:hypothetical protein